MGGEKGQEIISFSTWKETKGRREEQDGGRGVKKKADSVIK